VAIKLVTPSKEHLEKHYEDLSDKPFFKGLITCEFLIYTSSPLPKLLPPNLLLSLLSLHILRH
jgi:hypothetical protein